MRAPAVLLWVVACTNTTVPDGGADASFDGPDDGRDVAVDARVVGALEGPDIAFAGTETCFETGFPASEYTFVWGDGERDTSGDPRACHTWRLPGSYLVSVQADARDSSRPLAVVLPPATLRPQSSSPLLYDLTTHRAWIANADDDSVAVIDLSTETRTSFATCGTPRTVARSGRVVAVACQGGSLARYDADTLEALPAVALPAGSVPFGVVGDPRASDRFVVSLQEASALALVDGGVVSVVAVGADPRALTLAGDGRLLITRWRSAPEGATVVRAQLPTDGPPEIIREILLPRQEGLDSDTDNSGVPNFLDAILLTPDGERALVPALKANIVTGMFRTGEPLTSQTTARAVLMELLPTLDTGTYEESARIAFDDLDYASALAVTDLGDRIFVAMMGSQRVVALAGFGFDVVGSIANVGIAPRGLAIDREGRLLVFADLSRELRVYDVSNLSREPPVVARVSTVADEPLDAQVLLGKQIFHTSVDPRMSRTSYLSCASCHLDGEGDNLVWDFTQRGEGLRNTIPLRGRGVAHGAIHWSGNFDEIQDFENDIRNGQGGAGFLSEADWLATEDTLGAPKTGRSVELDALAAYVASLSGFGVSPLRSEGAAFQAQRNMGRSVFVSSGCATCHSGANFTDSEVGVRHDVGTLGAGSGGRLGGALDGLDTPTLRGLWRSGPYLHDGSASLREVLTTRNVGDAHGTTSSLTDEQRTALELYLMTLDDLDPG